LRRSAMLPPFRLIVVLFAGIEFADAATQTQTPENQPIEITSSGETTYENGLATARDNVAIHMGNTDIYSDYAQYNSKTHEVVAEGNVRVYRDISLYLADRVVYNTDTKQIRATHGKSSSGPYFV